MPGKVTWVRFPARIRAVYNITIFSFSIFNQTYIFAINFLPNVLPLRPQEFLGTVLMDLEGQKAKTFCDNFTTADELLSGLKYVFSLYL